MRQFDTETQAQWEKASTVLLPKGENREPAMEILAANDIKPPTFNYDGRCLHPGCS